MGLPESYTGQSTAVEEPVPMHHGEPIAIVGIGCRLPGQSNNPSSLWGLLKNPIDLSSPFPASRFNPQGFYHEDASHHGTTNSRGSYFLNDDDIQKFDAQFFNISPQEAESMDPQHRLLLEVVYEALEDAGIPLAKASGSATAAYVGLMTADWQDLQLRDMDAASRYLVTGGARSLASNRLSYFFNWHGPSETIDTACSSSLVAVHHAVQALRSGRATMAVAAGTNLLLAPDMYVMTSNLNMLSPTGKCHMWSSDADGYARGEGVACIMLKTVSKAMADGDHIYAIVRETGVNQDGNTTGITMPSSAAQARLIRETYKRAGLDLRRREDRCQYFEAHGTGTPAGDPVESQAIWDAFFSCPGQPEAAAEQLIVGSVKTVLGHLEGCAGIAGLIKVALGLQSSFIPGNLHLGTPNPKIAPMLDSGKLLVPTTGLPWPQTDSCRRASVNSFGFGGTNAHAILESFHDPRQQQQLPQRQSISKDAAGGATAAQSRTVTVVLSAASEPALADLVAKYAEYLETNPDVDLERLAWTTQKRRTRLPYGIPFIGSSRAALVRQMRTAEKAFRDGGQMGKLGPPSPSGRRELLGVFTGQGAQWATMGAKLLDASPVFAQTIALLEDVLSDTMADGEAEAQPWSLSEELRAPAGSSRIGEAEYAQPLSTAVQVALIDLLRSLGIEFSAVVGHSSGEMAAAYAAGFLSAPDAIRLAYFRGIFCKLGHSPNVGVSSTQVGAASEEARGGMMAANMSWDEALELCADEHLGFGGRVWVAANNAPKSVTLSGDLGKLREMQTLLRERNVPVQMLRVDKAYHSPHMNISADAFRAVLARCHLDGPPPPPGPGKKTPVWISSVFTDWAPLAADDESVPDLAWSPHYWIENMLAPVRFRDALERVARLKKIEVGVEVGPHAALRRQVSDTWVAAQGPIAYQGTLARGCNDQESFAIFMGFLWQHGFDVDFDAPCASMDKSLVGQVALTGLPSMPWMHTRVYWTESARLAQLIRRGPADDLIGHCIERGIVYDNDGSSRGNTRLGEWRWRQILRVSELPWLQGHKVQGQVVFPAAGYCVMAMRAAEQLVKSLSIGSTTRQGTTKSMADDGALELDLIELENVDIGRAIIFAENNRDGIDVTVRLHGITINKNGSRQVSDPAPSCIIDSSSTLEAYFSIQAQLPTAGEPGRPNEPFLACSGRLVGTIRSSLLPISNAMPAYFDDPVYMQDISPSTLYKTYAEAGLHYSAPFRLDSLERTFGRARSTLTHAKLNEFTTTTSCVPVAALDNSFQTALSAFSAPGDGRLLNAYLPRTIGRLRMHIAAFKNTATPESGFLFDATIKGRPESEDPANEPTSSWTASVEGILASPHDSATGTAGGRRIIFQVQDLFCVSLVPSEGPYRDGIFTEEIWAPDPEYALRELELEPEGLGDKAHLQTVEELTHYYICQVYQGFSREEAESDKTQWFIKRLWQWLDHVVGVSSGRASSTPSVEPFRNPWAEDPDRFRRLMERVEPMKNLVEIQILQAVANNMLRVMRQEEGPTILEVLFKDDMLGRLYREPAVYARVNRYLGRAAKAISHRFPRCDIIEVGAGTGGGTQAMFNGLRGAYHSYTFTDISSGFFTQAKVKFAAEVDRMVFKTLDVEKDAVEQGFSPAAYDIVVASNVLHATKDIGNSLANIRKLLKPGGYLLLIEVTAVDKVLVPFLMGAVPGWWLFQDKWRAGTFSPLLTPTGWDTVLRESGYDTGTENLFHDMSTPDDHLSSVIVARATDADWMDFQSCRTAPSSRFHSESIIVVASPDTYDRDAGPCISRQVAVDLSDSLSRFYNRHATEVEHAGKQPIITIVDSLDKALASPGFDKSVLVVLSDLDHPIMNGITPAAWEALKSTLGRVSQPIVWATRQRLCSGDPHQSMLVGMGRCARYENPGLVLRFVDLDCSDRSCPGPAAMRTLAREVWQANFKTSARGSWLGSVEHEVSIDKEGRLLLPRLVLVESSNERYLAGRRGLVHDEEDVEADTCDNNEVEDDYSSPPEEELSRPWHQSGNLPSPSLSEWAVSPVLTDHHQPVNLLLSHPKRLTLLGGLGKSPCYLSMARQRTTQEATLVLSSRLPARQNCTAATFAGTDDLFIPLGTIARGQSLASDHSFFSNLVRLLAADMVFRGHHGGCKQEPAIIILEPNKSLEPALIELSREWKRPLYIVTKRTFPPSTPLESPTDVTYLHPNMSPHRVSRLLSRHRKGLYLDWTCLRDVPNSNVSPEDGKETLGFPLPHGFKKVSEAGFLGRADLNNSFGSGFLEIPKLEKEALSARMQRIANLAAAAALSVTQEALNRDEIKQTGLIDWSAPMDDEGPPRILENPRHLFSPDKTYLFAGITSDLGLSMVKWLIENGARKIALTSRTPKLPKLWLDEMAALGARVFSFAMDVTDAISVQTFCSEIEASMGPVAGVVFGAMVLKDTLLESMPFDTLQSVLAPKVQGSRHVEAYFAHRALDFFIFMSSMSAIVGIRGQSNYCAGNMYGRALVRARRARGQAASTIDLSTVFGVGHFANAGRETLDAVRANLRGFNTLPIGVPDVLAAFHEAVLRGRPDAPGTGDVIVGLGSEEAVAGPHQPPVPAAWHGDPRFGYFTARASQRLMQDATAQSQGAGAARDGSRDVRKKLAAETTDQGRLATLSKCFALAVAETMQLPEGTPPRLDVRLMDYGIDSLVAMDLRAWFLRELEVSVPVLSILNGESIRELCKTVWSQMQSQ
ncbi:Type I Iterative PKS [Pyricularia oryzae]|nr:Type I Iterative PKS [Pyricularia oryzae]KAI6613377.1 Type I Iterative PKS [Pyricularia oryzae]